DAEPAQRLGLPPRGTVTDPWQPGELGVPAEQEIGEGAAGKVRGPDAVADVAPGPGDATLSVEPHARVPVARNPERATPGMREGGAAQSGEEVRQSGPERAEDVLVTVP